MVNRIFNIQQLIVCLICDQQLIYILIPNYFLLRHFNYNKLLTEIQIGYRSGYSRQSVLLELTDYILTGINELSVFDTVDYRILLLKLRKLSSLFMYLSNRSQAVVNGRWNYSEIPPTLPLVFLKAQFQVRSYLYCVYECSTRGYCYYFF